MTRTQLDLLIEYINLKAEVAEKRAKGDGVSPHTYDRTVEVLGELEELCDDE